MKRKILIGLDLIKYPNSGMGRVSYDFSKELIKTDAFDYTFLLPPKVCPNHLKNQSIKELNTYRKFTSSYMKEFDICHILHQLPKFSFNKAKRKVLTIHDLNFLYTKNKLKQNKYRHIVQSAIYKADAICFISEFTKNDCIANLHIPSDKLMTVIYNGVSKLDIPSSKPEWCPNGNFLFSIGQFLSKKNFHVLIPFLQQIPNEITLVIAGENTTSYGAEIKQLIIQHKLQNRLFLPGPISEREKSYLYHNCSAFVFPSIAEGFGLPIIEAMQCGKPVFCSDKTSLKEIGNKFAYFWEEFEPTSMLNVFNKGLANFGNKPEKMKSQQIYANTFNWSENVESYIKLYNQLI